MRYQFVIFLLLSQIIPSCQNKQTKTDWSDMAKYAKENKVLKQQTDPNRIVFMGNSITEFWKRDDPAFFEGKPYVNRGISGQTTPQMVLRFPADVIELKPAVVVILAGINDIAENSGPISLQEIFENIVSMAAMARRNNIKVILSSVLPAYDFPWRSGLQPAEKIIKLNGMIQLYANKNQLEYVDYYSAMVDERKGLDKEYAADEVHPNLAGYKVMAPLLEKAITKTMSKNK